MTDSASERESDKLFKALAKGRAPRNPVIAEKTPRGVDYSKWNYSVPAGKPVEERWKDQASSLQLLAKFSSQQERLKKEKDLMDAYYKRIQDFEDNEKKQQQQQQLVQTSNAASQQQPPPQSGRGANSLVGSAREPEWLTTQRSSSSQLTGRSSLTGTSTVRSDMSTSRLVEHLPLKDLKSLQFEHPGILSRLRAKRASRYLHTLLLEGGGGTDAALLPPPVRATLEREQFKPAGMLFRHPEHPTSADPKHGQNTRTRAAKEEKPLLSAFEKEVFCMKPSELKASLNCVLSELDKTENEIARQTLKIALSKKVKTFEKSVK